MTDEDFIAAASLVAHMGFNEQQRAELKALHDKVRDDTAHEIATGIDKKQQAYEKERVSDAKETSVKRQSPPRGTTGAPVRTNGG